MSHQHKQIASEFEIHTPTSHVSELDFCLACKGKTHILYMQSEFIFKIMFLV